ncbi:aldo/keto reductase [Levilactobacillus namurensis]|uniref:aldo/keto reductase n=1 Tax=Levilactobacillus namurensis TaxID=380393 RepID=UPI001D34F3BB|nr:aldo/keto reductase [Levilactobacillus namurensis]HJE45627.1 aldo/keto reductase [Levilactobacillus namurensis]
MQKRKLGNNLEVSAVGYGAMGLSHAYGPALDRSAAIKVIQSAIDQGYTLIDTAALYVGKYADGTPAINEKLVGAAIKPFRQEITLATKGGVRFEGTTLKLDSRPTELRREVEASLQRLGVDTIDLYYQHMPDPKVAPEEVAETMGDLIREGKIKHWGISNADADYIQRADAVTKVTAVQGKFSMIARQSARLFPMLAQRQIGFVAYSPLASGFLTAPTSSERNRQDNLDFRNMMHQYTAEGKAEARDISTMLGQLAREKQATPSQISLAWVLHKEPWIVPIPGTRQVNRLAENAAAETINLSDTEMAQIDELLDRVNYEQYGQ